MLESKGIVFTGRKKESGGKKLDTLVYGKLIIASAKDINTYRKYLMEASDGQIREAIKIMEDRNCRDKGRIATCKEELKRRSRCDDVESENI